MCLKIKIFTWHYAGFEHMAFNISKSTHLRSCVGTFLPPLPFTGWN